MADIQGAPIYTPLIGNVKDLLVQAKWATWLRDVIAALNLTARKLGEVGLSAQGGAIAATAIPMGTNLPAGLYRVSYVARITRPATTSSSLQITLGWTIGGVACSQAGAAMTGNTTATVQSGSVLVKIDKATTITYAATYASVGATSMQFSVDIRVDAVP